MTSGSAKVGPSFPTLLTAYTARPLSITFDFVRLRSSFTDSTGTYDATFWVTGDALKWEIPDSEALLLSEWDKYKEPDPSDENGKMLCRLPCSAKQNQEIADVITTHPDPIKSGSVGGLINHKAPIRSHMMPEPSLLLTPKLYDLRWAQSKAQIKPCNQDINLPIVGESAKLNKCVNTQIRNVMKAAGTTTTIPNIIGDPGKIWAVTNDVYANREETVTRKNGTTYTYKYKAAVNYGWHGRNLQSQAVTPGQTVIQSVGMRHDATHIDYSQVAVLIAGWCEVTKPGETGPTFMRTEAVYRDQTLCQLITHDAKPLTVTRY
ncbi:MAG: hypothetical protein HUU21_11230 [Polyangiaceae bacterium]|nr:hypothetical protein [Polyangiaceae bacterium]